MKSKSRIITVPAQKTPNISLGKLRVSWETLPITTDFSEEDMRCFHHCLDAFDSEPKTTLRTLHKLKEKYPSSFDVLYFLSIACAQKKKVRQSFRYIRENFAHNPDNLLARIQFGHMLAVKKRWNEVSTLFDSVWDLKALCPEREVFHIAEYRGFFNLAAHVYLSEGRREAALELHYLLSKMAPNHPSTASLEKKVRKQWRRTLLTRLLPRLFARH